VSYETKVLIVQMASGVSGKLMDAKDQNRLPDHPGVYAAERLNHLLAEMAADGWEVSFQPLPSPDLTHVYLFLRRDLR
jgi:hypothetical protein